MARDITLLVEVVIIVLFSAIETVVFMCWFNKKMRDLVDETEEAWHG